jgi:hypothetical protein
LGTLAVNAGRIERSEVGADDALLVEAEVAREGAVIRVGVHDASRVEWSVSVPLPERRPLAYTIDVTIQVPSNAFARHSPWDQLQSFTRLDAQVESHGDEPGTIDGLRRCAISLASRLSHASEGFARHCHMALARAADLPIREADLRIWVDAAVRMTADARARVVRPDKRDPAQLACERALVDEYASLRLLEMLAGAERELRTVVEARPHGGDAVGAMAAGVEAHVADVLEEELAYRARHGFVCPDPSSTEALERFVERASRLKKHFQEVLFLEPEVFEVAARIHNWVAAFVAIVASTWAFAWQIALSTRSSTGSQVGSGILLLALMAAFVYALKDRIKEVGRDWIAGNVRRLYAQRVASFRAPARRLEGRDLIVRARESIDQTARLLPDPLNPESGATTPATVIRYRHIGSVFPQRALTAAGVRRVKHVFRYDLSPLFARLDDAVKPVPLVDAATHRVNFVDAPRVYRVPIELVVREHGRSWRQAGTIVLHKRGLERFELA